VTDRAALHRPLQPPQAARQRAATRTRQPRQHRPPSKAKRSLFRRVARVVWVSPRHFALAFATGVVCGALAARDIGRIAPPYAAIIGTIVVDPVLIGAWRLVSARILTAIPVRRGKR
jgi:hypothetical protein